MDEIISMMRANFYGNVDPRRKQERVDGSLVAEDHGSMANLSNTAIHREWNPWKNVERLDMFDQSDPSKKGE